MQDMIQTIYVRLLDEDIDVFVPVHARQVFDNIFEIIVYGKDLETEHLNLTLAIRL